MTAEGLISEEEAVQRVDVARFRDHLGRQKLARGTIGKKIGFVSTLALTALLFSIVPKGFFPVQDTGVIQGVSVAAESVINNSAEVSASWP